MMTVRPAITSLFSQACVKSSVHGGVSASVHAGIHPLGRPSPADTPPWADTLPPGKHTPLGSTPPGSTPPREAHLPSPRRSLQRTVRVLLECFLVFFFSSRLYHLLDLPVFSLLQPEPIVPSKIFLQELHYRFV